MGIRVHEGGLLTTIQDLGRIGHQAKGVSVSGAMDAYAYQIANLLVGNPLHFPAIEIMIMGPTLETDADLIIAVTGADLGLEIEGQPAPLWKPILWRKGEILRFHGGNRQGACAYLAIQNGFQCDSFFGSAATDLTAKMGGFQGRALQKNDYIKTFHPPRNSSVLRRQLSPTCIPKYTSHKNLRIIWGIHQEAFTEKGLNTFLTSKYQVTPQANRMGIRLAGPVIEHKHSADVISTTVTLGTIQVPANGQPIILLADRQTTGGYTQIAHVITVDLPLLAQSLPGHTISFQSISVQEAERLARDQYRLLKKLQILNQ